MNIKVNKMKLESVTVLFLVSLVIVNSQVVFEDEEEQRKPPSRSFDKNKNDNILVTITLGQPSSQSQSGFRRPSQQQSFQQRPNEFGFGNNNGFQQTRPFQHNSNGNFPNQQGSFQSNQGFRRPSGPPANNFQNQQGTNGPGIIIIPPSSTTTTTSTTTTPFPIQPIPESTKKPFIGSQGGSLIIGNGPVALVSPVQANWSTPVNFSEEGLPAECGVSKVGNTRIVGGLPAKKGAWPWIAALGYREHTGNVNYLCGGALVSSIYVVTASHCLYGRNDLVSVRLGDHDLYSEGDGAKPIEAGVEKIILHPNYDPATFKNDIALIKLKRPVQFSDEIRPICLPSTPKLRNERFENAAPFVAGWGAIQFNGPTSSELRQVQVHTVPDNDCQQKYSSFKTAVVDDTNVCAGVQGGGKDACQGDSGGPLQQPVGTRNKYVLIGVVSFGFKCAEPGFPGVYTRVTAHIDWLQKTMEP